MGIFPMGNSGRFPQGKLAATLMNYKCKLGLFCFRNPSNSDMDERIFNLRRSAQHFDSPGSNLKSLDLESHALPTGPLRHPTLELNERMKHWSLCTRLTWSRGRRTWPSLLAASARANLVGREATCTDTEKHATWYQLLPFHIAVAAGSLVGGVFAWCDMEPTAVIIWMRW